MTPPDQKRSWPIMLDLSVLDRHERIALGFSGGKDSTACIYLLRDHLDRIKVIHLDTGDLVPEMREHVARVATWVPHFIRIETNVQQWISENGFPSDLVPHSAHPVGRLMGENRTKLVPRYECCWHNLMLPFFKRVTAEGCSLLIRGTKRTDMPRLPVSSGEASDGVELFYPLQEWSHDEVFAYLASQGVELPRMYRYSTNSFECARCPAWWGERRASYLKQYHPELFADYRQRMTLVMRELQEPLTNLAREVADMGGLADGS